MLPNGTPVACQAAVFNSGAGSCTIYSATSQQAQLVNSQGAFYLERVCLSSSIDPRCPGERGFLGVPDQMIPGNALGSTQASSFSDCLQQCLLQRQNCKGANYYPADRKCDLKSANDPQQLVPISGGSKGYFLDASCPPPTDAQQVIILNREENSKALEVPFDEKSPSSLLRR